MNEMEIELAEAHRRCQFITMGQYFNTWFCGLYEQFEYRGKFEKFCVLQNAGECNPTDMIHRRLKELENAKLLAEKLLGMVE